MSRTPPFSVPRLLLALVGALALALAVLPALPAYAADFTVTTLADTNDDDLGDEVCADAAGACSLRAAVQQSNANDEADTITLPDLGAPYALVLVGAGEDAAATGDLDVTDELTITGAGADAVTIDATALGDRILDVLGAPLTLSGVTLTGGTANAAPDDRGGAIRVDVGSTLDLTGAVIDGNTAPLAGGGIENTGGAVTIVETDFTGNVATGDPMAGNGGALHAAGGTTAVTGGTVAGNTAVEGGGFWVGGAGTLTVDGTTFDGNAAVGADPAQGGGALYAEGGSTLDVTDATLTGNTATTGSGSGGAILANETDTALTVAGSTLTGNAANRAGGGIEVAGPAAATISGSDFTENDVADGAMPGNGGALHNGGGTVGVSGGTAQGNTAIEGGAFWNGGAGDLDVDGTDFQANAALGGEEGQGGGALYNEGMGNLAVAASTFAANDATAGAGSGGAILNTETDTVLALSDSTFEGNTADRAGGAIENAGAVANISGSTFTGNEATGDDSAGNGGALHDGGGDVTVTGGSVEQNTAVEGGGFWTSGVITVSGTTLRGNVATAGGAFYVDEGGQLDLDGVTGTDDQATGDGNELFDNGGATSAVDTTLTSVIDGLTCNVPVDDNRGGNVDDDGSCFLAGVQIDRIFGEGRTQTAIAVSQDQFADGEADAVTLSRPDIYPDALAGTPLAAQENGPLLLTSQDGLEDAVAAELQRVLGDDGTIFLLGGTAALSAQVQSDVEALGYDVVRYGGANRFETAVVIATDGLDEPDQILLADGSDFPDAVAAGAAAANTNGAVVLTGDDTVPPETAVLIDETATPLFAIGGPAARAVPSATPVVGADRIATSIAVATTFFDAPDLVGIAQAGDFPDALTGGVLTGMQGGPLLLTFGDDLSPEVADYLAAQQDSIDRVVLFGGLDALSQGVEDQVGDVFAMDG